MWYINGGIESRHGTEERAMHFRLIDVMRMALAGKNPAGCRLQFTLRGQPGETTLDMERFTARCNRRIKREFGLIGLLVSSGDPMVSWMVCKCTSSSGEVEKRPIGHFFVIVRVNAFQWRCWQLLRSCWQCLRSRHGEA